MGSTPTSHYGTKHTERQCELSLQAAPSLVRSSGAWDTGPGPLPRGAGAGDQDEGLFAPPPLGPSPGLVSRRINGHTPEKRASLTVLPRDVIIRRVTSHSSILSRPLTAQVDVVPDAWDRPRVVVVHPGGGARGKVTHLSPAARRRMLLTARNVEGLVVLLTLTYPAEYPTDGRRVKRNWAAMRTWLRRRGLGGFWFLEFQRRGAPHFHVFLTGRVDKAAVADAWFRIVGSGDPKHLEAGTRVEALRSPHAAAAYAAKYAVKAEQKGVPEDYQEVGRFWGRFGGLVLEPLEVIQGPLEQVAVVIRLAKGVDRAQRRAAGLGRRRDNGRWGLTVWGVGPQLLRALAQLRAGPPLARVLP